MNERTEVLKQIHGDLKPIKITVQTVFEPMTFEGKIWRIEFRDTHIRVGLTNASNMPGSEQQEWLFPINTVKYIEIIGAYS